MYCPKHRPSIQYTYELHGKVVFPGVAEAVIIEMKQVAGVLSNSRIIKYNIGDPSICENINRKKFGNPPSVKV